MNNRATITLLSFTAILLLIPQAISRELPAKRLRDGLQKESFSQADWPEQERTDRVYQLSPGARVEVSMIYGPVDIETSEGQAAEVHITRFARAVQDLADRKISIDHTPASLVIRGEKDQSEAPARVRHRVLLRLQQQVALLAQNINARLNVGEINGFVRLSSINGAVVVASAGYSEVSRINGSLNMGLTRLGSRGVLIDHVNGSVDLRFTENLNADVTVTDFNGSVRTDLTAVVLEKTERTLFRARFGSGGAPISISDVNGSVRLAPGR
jgi:hypothetical protein